jgi:hypothetical protein
VSPSRLIALKDTPCLFRRPSRDLPPFNRSAPCQACAPTACLTDFMAVALPSSHTMYIPHRWHRRVANPSHNARHFARVQAASIPHPLLLLWIRPPTLPACDRGPPPETKGGRPSVGYPDCLIAEPILLCLPRPLVPCNHTRLICLTNTCRTGRAASSTPRLVAVTLRLVCCRVILLQPPTNTNARIADDKAGRIASLLMHPIQPCW